MDKHTRTILLPKGSSDFEIVPLPDFKCLTETRKYGKSGDDIYELKSIKESPKSIIFEPGWIIENSEIILTSKINPTYLLISALFDNTKFITVDDISDKFPWVEHFALEKYLHKICDSIEENGELFYKIDRSKVTSYLNARVYKVKQNLKNSKLSNYLKLELYVTSETEITDELWELQLNDTAVNFVWEYLSIDRYDHFVSSEQLAKHKRDINSKLSSNMLINNQGKDEVKKPVKKPVKKQSKVAVGKGALDAFFKKTK